MNRGAQHARQGKRGSARDVDERVNDLVKRSFAFEVALNIIDASIALIDFAK
jgi:hypothetical protein